MEQFLEVEGKVGIAALKCLGTLSGDKAFRLVSDQEPEQAQPHLIGKHLKNT